LRIVPKTRSDFNTHSFESECSIEI
jgi:hypothetical protein